MGYGLEVFFLCESYYYIYQDKVELNLSNLALGI